MDVQTKDYIDNLTMNSQITFKESENFMSVVAWGSVIVDSTDSNGNRNIRFYQHKKIGISPIDIYKELVQIEGSFEDVLEFLNQNYDGPFTKTEWMNINPLSFSEYCDRMSLSEVDDIHICDEFIATVAHFNLVTIMDRSKISKRNAFNVSYQCKDVNKDHSEFIKEIKEFDKLSEVSEFLNKTCDAYVKNNGTYEMELLKKEK